jgi:multiple sugar transport system substrate-binding protein
MVTSLGFRKKFGIALALTIVLVLAMQPILSHSTVKARQDKLTIALVLNTSDYKTVEPLVQQWKEQTGVEIEVIEENTQTYVADYVLAANTKSPKLDMIMFWDFYLDQLAPMLTPLDGSVDPAVALSDEDRADFMDIALTDYNGHPYIMPYSLDTRLLYYRTDLLEAAGFTEPPQTWDQLVEYAQALTKDLDGDGNTDQWGFVSLGLAGQVFNTYTFFDFLFQKGGQIFDENGKSAFNSPEGVEALQFMVDLKNLYKVMPPDVITYDNNEVHEGFLAGKFAMTNHWPYMFGMTAGTDLENVVGYAPEPAPEGGSSVTTFNRWGFGIPLMSENKELAWDLVKFLTNTQSGAFEYSQMLDWPMRASAYQVPEVIDQLPERHRLFSEFVFDIAKSHAETTILPRGGETSQVLGEYIDQAMAGAMSPEDALNEAADAINQLLEE